MVSFHHYCVLYRNNFSSPNLLLAPLLIQVTMDIRAKKNGVFVEGLVSEQGEISVGADLYKMDTSATAAPAKQEKAAEPKAEKAAPAAAAPKAEKMTVPVPIMGESITSGVLSSWAVKVGDSVPADHVVATVETDKVSTVR